MSTAPQDETMQVIPASRSSHKADKIVDLSWENLTYRVKVDVVDPETGVKSQGWKTIVHGVSGVARGGRVLAIMGPSGAGKTTLLNSIAGRVPITQNCEIDGCAFLNQTVLTEKYKRCISYVAQDDICMAKDTPREALYFASRCRCGTTIEEAEKEVNETLERLHLTKAADTILGIPGLVKGVSGGEKKRTNIGSELITNPYIMLLDEPTTGLDSVNAARVGALLRELAHDEDRTVMCTIHTPSSELFALFDDLLLLAKGHVIFHGPVEESVNYFESVGYPVPPRTNPSEYYMNLLQLPEDELETLWTNWANYASSSDAQSNLSIKPVDQELVTEDPVLEQHAQPTRASAAGQLGLLVGRSWRNAFRDPTITVGRLVQTLFLSILMSLLFFDMDPTASGVQDRLGILFMISLDTIFLALMPGIATFPPERAVFLMEQANESYYPWAYFLSKMIAEIPYQIIFPTIYLSILYFMVGLVNTAEQFFIALLFCIVASVVSVTFGLVAASFFPTPEMSMAMVPTFVLPMAIVGGLFANTDRLEPYWIWLNYVSFIRYVYKGLTVNEFENIGSLCNTAINVTAGNATADPFTTGCPWKDGDEVVRFMGFDKDSDTWWMTVIILGVYVIGLFVIGSAILTYQSSTKTPKFAFHKNVDNRVASPKRTDKWVVQASPSAKRSPDGFVDDEF